MTAEENKMSHEGKTQESKSGNGMKMLRTGREENRKE